MLVFVVLAFAATLLAVRLTQKITNELSWKAAVRITMLMLAVYGYILALARKVSQS